MEDQSTLARVPLRFAVPAISVSHVIEHILCRVNLKMVHVHPLHLLLRCALDPLVISRESKPPGRELVESSARKLLLELVEFGERSPDPDLPKPASITAQRKKQSLDLLDNKSSKNVDMKNLRGEHSVVRH